MADNSPSIITKIVGFATNPYSAKSSQYYVTSGIKDTTVASAGQVKRREVADLRLDTGDEPHYNVFCERFMLRWFLTALGIPGWFWLKGQQRY
jgi:hypothetical protein